MEGAELDLGLQAFRHAGTLNPNDPSIHAAIGQGLMLMKKFAEAKSEYEAAAALLPNDPYYSTMPIRVMAVAARSDEDYSRSVAELQAALARYPDDDGLRAELAGLHMRFNQFKLARQELETILTHNPMISSDGLFNLYTVCKRLGDQRAAEDARARFQQLIALKDAATELTELARMHPTDARVFLRLSIALLQLRQIDKAYATLRQASALDPNDPEIARAMQGAQKILRARQESGSASEGTPR
jgi:Flp pilus assembly protein TadD